MTDKQVLKRQCIVKLCEVREQGRLIGHIAECSTPVFHPNRNNRQRSMLDVLDKLRFSIGILAAFKRLFLTPPCMAHVITLFSCCIHAASPKASVQPPNVSSSTAGAQARSLFRACMPCLSSQCITTNQKLTGARPKPAQRKRGFRFRTAETYPVRLLAHGKVGLPDRQCSLLRAWGPPVHLSSVPRKASCQYGSSRRSPSTLCRIAGAGLSPCPHQNKSSPHQKYLDVAVCSSVL